MALFLCLKQYNTVFCQVSVQHFICHTAIFGINLGTELFSSLPIYNNFVLGNNVALSHLDARLFQRKLYRIVTFWSSGFLCGLVDTKFCFLNKRKRSLL